MNKRIISEQLDIQEKDILFEFFPNKYDIITDNYNTSYLNNILLKINLPSIYSTSQRQFKWVKYLGYNIIDKIQCKISFLDSTNVSEINLYTYSEWLYIWYEINLSDSEKNLHYNLIGHVQELYDPALNNNNIYPSSHLQKQKYKWLITDNNLNQATTIVNETDFNFNKPPSINSRTLYIPLNFSFCNTITNMLPINKIKKIDVIINLKDYNKLYTVLLQPEDFIIDDDSNINLSDTNYNSSFVLPSDINFVNNKSTIFSSDKHLYDNSSNISLFDTIINEYRITPSKTGLSSINKFLLNSNTSINSLLSTNSDLNILDSLESQIKFTKNNFYNLCNPYILFSIYIGKRYTKNYIKINGLFNDVTSTEFNPQIIPNLNDDLKTGYINDYNLTLNLNNKINNTSELFFYFKHNQRNNKNDCLNFTNYDFNNNKLWNNNIKTANNNLNIISNSIWDNVYTFNDVKIEMNELGRFAIKKKVKEKNTIKFINVFEYQTEYENNNNVLQYNVNSYKFYNENIINNFNIELETMSNNKLSYTTEKESYDFYNKVTLYNNYKSTVPGLYYLNFSHKPIENISKILVNNFTGNLLNINDDNLYNIYLYIIDNKKILFTEVELLKE